MKEYYINILQYLLLQYNTIWLIGNFNILCITIYCSVCCRNVIHTQSLHYKIDWTWIIHLSFSYFYVVIQGAYSLLYCQNPYSHMKWPFTKIQSNIETWQCIVIHSNTIRNTALTCIVSPLEYSISFL